MPAIHGASCGKQPSKQYDESQGLGITANAVRQHLTALERDGLVAKGETQSSGGRPEQLYELTPAGNELFPRHYSWFAELLLDSLRTEKDSDALRERLESMGRAVARQVEARVAGLEDMSDRIRVLAAIMHELGYESGPVDSPKELMLTELRPGNRSGARVQSLPILACEILALTDRVHFTGLILG